jgi:hypothetical protein
MVTRNAVQVLAESALPMAPVPRPRPAQPIRLLVTEALRRRRDVQLVRPGTDVDWIDC